MFMATIPSWLEAFTITFLVQYFFDMPLTLCFAIGFLIAAVSPSITVPGLLNLIDQGYGVDNGICQTLISAGTVDDIIAIILFSVLKSVAYRDEKIDGGRDFSLSIGLLFIEQLAGLAVGICLGLIGYFFKYIEKNSYTVYLKFTWCTIVAVGLAAAAEFSTLTNSRYLACLSFGYVNYRIWGESGRPTV